MAIPGTGRDFWDMFPPKSRTVGTQSDHVWNWSMMTALFRNVRCCGVTQCIINHRNFVTVIWSFLPKRTAVEEERRNNRYVIRLSREYDNQESCFVIVEDKWRGLQYNTMNVLPDAYISPCDIIISHTVWVTLSDAYQIIIIGRNQSILCFFSSFSQTKEQTC